MKSAKELFDLSGKVAIVTGGRGLYGKSITEGLCEMGASVVIASRNKARCEELAAELREKGLDAVGAKLDLADDESIKELVASVLSEYGKIAGHPAETAGFLQYKPAGAADALERGASSGHDPGRVRQYYQYQFHERT